MLNRSRRTQRCFLVATLITTAFYIGCDDGITDSDGITISLSPASDTILQFDTLRLTPTVTQDDAPMSATISWTSSDTLVAKVSSSGTVTGREAGSAIITAQVGSTRAFAHIVVKSTLQTACAGGGKLHSGQRATDTWRAADNPHILIDSVIVGELTIEAGSIVCGMPGSLIVLRAPHPATAWLDARGTADKPIRFTAAHLTQKWGGIDGNGGGGSAGASATITYALIELATRGISGWGGTTTIRDSRIRHSNLDYCAFTGASRVDIRRTTVDTAVVCVSSGTFEDNVIRGGRLTISKNRTAPSLAINGGRIEGSPGVGFTVARNTGSFSGPPSVSSTRPLRIIGSASHPIDIDLETFSQMWPTPESQDSLLGNAENTLILWGSGSLLTRPLYLRQDLPWIVSTNSAYFPGGTYISDLTIEPGSSLQIDRLVVYGNLTAPGTIANPIRIAADSQGTAGLILSDTATSTLSNVIFTGQTITANQQHQVTLNGINSTGWIELGSAGSSISDSKIHSVPAGQDGRGMAAIIISAPDVQILRCDVADNGGDGIRVLPFVTGNVGIHDCNLERNAGFGVNNLAAFTVDARRNWWGDPAGPTGPSGDGVSGNVDAGNPLSAPRP